MIELKCVGKDVRAFKRCPGYADRPAHTVPIVGFNSSGETLDYYCVECRKSSRKYSTSNTIVALVEKYIPRKIRRTHPQRIKMNAFAREVYLSNRTEQELKEFIHSIISGVWNKPVDIKYHITSDGKYYYEPKNLKPLRTVTTTVKPRNSSLVTYLKEKYNYTCQVRGCSEQEVDVAHLHPHRYKDSVDDETNAAVLCKNHHWSLDWKRMYIEDDLSFTRYNLDGKIIEESTIVCHEDHNIDAKFITKSQDWSLGGMNDRKKQEMG
jgi:mRNA-degrading endonuclease HigB of HigAB toxin-antitoxin module